MITQPRLSLFEGYGIELEYMIVNKDNLEVYPIADKVLSAIAGKLINEVEMGEIACSNELVQHVIELKTNGPTSRLRELPEWFQQGLEKINDILAPMQGCIMPTAMHPWMHPDTETRLWPYGNKEIYQTYDRIFGCQGHGWSNLQSIHINLPFSSDSEFALLHSAIRLVLPILPGIAASSPIVEGSTNGVMDNRLEFYRHNQKKIPFISGGVIPEVILSMEQYRKEILARIYQEIAPYDPKKILQEEWLNSRGVIARFERYALEIRVLDIQECPRADMAIITAIISTLQALVTDFWKSRIKIDSWPSALLQEIFLSAIREGSRAVINHTDFCRIFGLEVENPCTVGQLWNHIVEDLLQEGIFPLSDFQQELRLILEQGTLAERICAALQDEPGLPVQRKIYQKLCELSVTGEMFNGLF